MHVPKLAGAKGRNCEGRKGQLGTDGEGIITLANANRGSINTC